MEQRKTNKAASDKVLQECRDAKSSVWSDMQDDEGWSLSMPAPGKTGVAGVSSFPKSQKDRTANATPKPKAKSKGKCKHPNVF